MATTASIEAPAGQQSTAIERSLALGLAAVATALNVAALVLGLAATAVVGTLAVTPIGTYGAFVFVLTLVAVGLILRARRADHRLGWTFLGFGLVAAVSHLCWSVMLGAQLPGSDSTTAAWVSWIGATVSILGWPYLVTAILVRFPTGAPESRLEARVLRSGAVVCAVAVVFVALRPGPLFAYPGFVNPVAVPTDLRPLLKVAADLAILVALGPPSVAVVAMVARYRRAELIERLQLRWFAFGASLTMAGAVVYVVFGVLIAPDSTVVRETTFVVFILSACVLPIAVLVAISRYHLFDIDRIIGRAVAYGALTAILAGLYAASVRLFNFLFVTATGQQSEVALVLTTLVLATTFTPIKGSLERAAAKRFPAEPGSAEVVGGGVAVGGAAIAVDAALPADLDARIESIAKRVALEVLREERG